MYLYTKYVLCHFRDKLLFEIVLVLVFRRFEETIKTLFTNGFFLLV